MNNILLIVPTEKEAAYFGAQGLRAHICGAGMAECAATTAQLLSQHKPDVAILAGIAGTHTEALKIGDTVAVATETITDLGRSERRQRLNSSSPEQYEVFVPLFQKTYPAGFVPKDFPTATGHTVNMAGGSSETKHDGVVIENMEGAAFFAICERFGVPAAEIRTISNRVGEPVTKENLDHAARHLAAALKSLLP